VKGEQQAAQECYRIALKPSCTRRAIERQSGDQVLAIKDTSALNMETEEIILNTSYPDRKALIGNDIHIPSGMI